MSRRSERRAARSWQRRARRALTTGARVGELLGLTWADVQRDEHGEAQAFKLSADTTKTGAARTLPIGWRLRAELSMRRHAPDGEEHPATTYVFGNEVGEQVT